MTWSLARLARLLATVLLLSVAVPLAGQAVQQAASASEPSVESQLLSLTNSARVRAGLPALQSSSTLVAIARAWSNHMAATGQLAHNPGVAGKVSGWSSLGENVAKAYSASQAQSLFMGSPDHRANILQRYYNRVGIGVTRAADGSLWFTVDFEQTSGYSPPAASTKKAVKPARKAPARKASSSTAAARLAAARLAAANRANRSLTRGAVPTVVRPALPAPVAAGPATVALARLARLDGLQAAAGSPPLLAGALSPPSPPGPAGQQPPVAIVAMAVVAVLSAGGAVAAHALQLRAGRAL